MNIGAPINDVTMPAGNSEGAITERAKASDSTSNEEPSNTEPGIIYLCPLPNINLEIFGIINPTNEIIPAIDTAAAASSEDNITEISCILFKFNPSVTDSSSPRYITSKSLLNRKEKITAINTIGNVNKNSFHPFPERPPFSQYIICVILLPDNNKRSPLTEEKSAFKAIPASIILLDDI